MLQYKTNKKPYLQSVRRCRHGQLQQYISILGIFITRRNKLMNKRMETKSGKERERERERETPKRTPKVMRNFVPPKKTLNMT